MAKNKKPAKNNKKTARMRGTMHIASNNIGYVAVEDMEQDVQIQTQFLNTALHGDEVEIALLPKHPSDTRVQGEVTRVVERARTEFVGTIDKKDPERNFAFLIPDDYRMQRDIFIPDARDKSVKHNHKAVVRIIDWGDTKKNPAGEIVRMLGKKGDNEVEMESILFESGYRPGFEKEIVEEARSIQKRAKPIPEQEITARVDLRDLPALTIDPADAKDLDDALSVKPLDNGMFEVGIHIADVSHYVRPGSLLDKEAKRKGTSVYLVDRTSPMLPEELSNDLCSLNPEEDKLAFSALLTMTKDGEVKDRWFGKTVVRTNARFSYEEAQAIIDDDKKNAPLANELRTLSVISKNLQEKSRQRGALEFEQVEINFELDENGKPVRIYEKDMVPTHKLIEEFMIVANREVAGYLKEQIKKQGGFGVFRNHNVPERKEINDLLEFLHTKGYELEFPGKTTFAAKELNKVFEAVKGEDEEYLVEMAAMKDMEKAVYSVENKGHWGLALEHYTHFTSPIRRYADLMVHRIMQGYLEKQPVRESEEPKYKKVLEGLLQKEINAVDAERSSNKYKQVEYMLGKKGQTFEGIVVSVFNWGMFIQENKTKSEGLVKTRDMQDDFYEIDETSYSLVGTRTNKKYTIGDTVKFKVIGGDLEQKMLDLKLV